MHQLTRCSSSVKLVYVANIHFNRKKSVVLIPTTYTGITDTHQPLTYIHLHLYKTADSIRCPNNQAIIVFYAVEWPSLRTWDWLSCGRETATHQIDTHSPQMRSEIRLLDPWWRLVWVTGGVGVILQTVRVTIVNWSKCEAPCGKHSQVDTQQAPMLRYSPHPITTNKQPMFVR